jgi:hypothetical protein
MNIIMKWHNNTQHCDHKPFQDLVIIDGKWKSSVQQREKEGTRQFNCEKQVLHPLLYSCKQMFFGDHVM